MENTGQSQTSKSIFRNVLYGLSTWILPLVLSFVSTPIILRSLGDKDYGIYALVLGFIAYSFNLSFGRAITKYVAEYRANGENEKIRDIISATLFINVSVGITVILLVFAAADYLVADVFQIAAEDQSKTVFALHIASLTLFFLILNQVFNSILQGIHRFDVFSKITNFNSVGIIAGNIFLALNGYGLLILLSWNLLITFTSCTFFIISAKRCLPEFGITFRFPKTTIVTVLKFSAGVIGQQIISNLFILFERGWITRKLGTENLTYYVVPMMLAISIHSFISSIVIVVFPLASELKDQPDRLLRLYSKATKVVCFLVVFIETSVIIHSRDFLTLWMNAEFAEKTHLILIIHATTFSLLAVQTIAWQMTEGLGFPQFNTFTFTICTLINVILVLILTDNYGNAGIAFARLAGFAVVFLSLFYIEKWFFGQIQLKFWFRLSALLGAAIALSAIFQEFIAHYFPLSWSSFFISVGGGGIIYCLTLFVSGYITADEKMLVRNLLKRSSPVSG
ncbi:MAG: oligosaccharide flippase family protein [Pyrinomonadaceae bacterium]|nr:oligosaccharide flippase family protein [Pyrinomonadaceae bacterium]